MKKQFAGILWICLLISCGNHDTRPTTEKKNTGEHDHTMMHGSATYCDSVNTGLITADTMKGSPLRTAMNTIGGGHVHIEYSSPGVKNRITWGGLVPYDQVWVTGAHHATVITFYKDTEAGNTKIDKGTYALFTIPGRDSWTVILNRNYDQHLADAYNEKDDVVRVQVQPREHPFTPRLTYTIEPAGEKEGSINILWDKLKISLPFKTL